MKKRHVIGVLLVLAVFAMFISCESLSSMFTKSDSGGSKEPASNDPLAGYVIIPTGGSYHVAKVVKPASAETKGQAEVIDMMYDEKVWAEVIETHPASNDELVVGAVVFHQGSGFEDPDKGTLISTAWEAYYVTDTSDLFKGRILIGGDLDVSTKHLRIPDGEIDM